MFILGQISLIGKCSFNQCPCALTQELMPFSDIHEKIRVILSETPIFFSSAPEQ